MLPKFHHSNYLFCIFYFLIFNSILFGGQLGIGISLPERGGTMIDQVHEHYRWSRAGGGELTAADVDNRGWPAVDCRYVKDWRPVAEWAGEIDDPEGYRIDMSGLYRCSFKGQATLSNLGNDYTISNQLYDEETNTTSFDLTIGAPGPGHGLLILEFINTKRTPQSTVGSGITHFRMTRPGYNHYSTEIFTDEFISTLTSAGFSAIRFMDFRHTNNSEPVYPAVTEWSQRKLPTDAGQGQIIPLGKLDGAAWEYVIELGNLVDMDIWINIQVSATKDYVRQLATLLRDNLDPGLNIYVESSNEVWNGIFNQHAYNIAQAEDLGIGEHENHARRTVELAGIFEEVFGEGSLNNRVRVILCSHAPMLKWWVIPMLEYINSEFGAPSDYVYAIARQTYFSTGERAGTVEELLDRCHADISTQISETAGNESGRQQWVDAADKWNLTGGLCSYEGGFHIPSGGSTLNLANQIQMHRNPRAAEELIYNFEDAFFDLGGNLAIQFTLTSGYNRYGCWGLTDDVSDPDRNHKFQAIRDLIENQTSIEQSVSLIPEICHLYQNFPNPFNPETAIRYKVGSIEAYDYTPQHSLQRETHHHASLGVDLAIYNLQGRRVSTLVSARQPAGTYEVKWNARSFPTGIYFYRLFVEGEYVESRKLVLIR